MSFLLSQTLPKSGPLRVAYLTWNLADQAPTSEDIDTLLKSHDGEIDLLVIATQEETRNQKKSLGSRIGKQLHSKHTLRAAFDTRTNMFSAGCQSQTFISNHEIKIEPTNTVKHAAKSENWFKRLFFQNKGGLSATIQIGAHIMHCTGTHLDAYDASARLTQTQALLSHANTLPQKATYEDIEKLLLMPTIFGGDLNYRNLISTDKTTDPFDDLQNSAAKHFALHGLQEAKDAAKLRQNTYINKISYAWWKRLLGIKSKLYDSNTPDKKRFGETQGGELDKILYRGNATMISESTVIMPKTRDVISTSDHEARFALFEIKSLTDTERFEAAKNAVIHQIDTVFGNNACQEIKTVIAALPMSETTQLRDVYQKLHRSLHTEILPAEQIRVRALQLDNQANMIEKKSKPFYRIFTNQTQWQKKQMGQAQVYRAQANDLRKQYKNHMHWIIASFQASQAVVNLKLPEIATTVVASPISFLPAFTPQQQINVIQLSPASTKIDGSPGPNDSINSMTSTPIMPCGSNNTCFFPAKKEGAPVIGNASPFIVPNTSDLDLVAS